MKSHHIYSHLLGILCVCQLYLNKTGKKDLVEVCQSLPQVLKVQTLSLNKMVYFFYSFATELK